jgi:hypothetical protein
MVSLPYLAKHSPCPNFSLLSRETHGSVSPVITKTGFFSRSPKPHTCCDALICRENSQDVMGFAIFISILGEIFLQSLQPTEEKNIEDLENMRLVGWIGQQ